MGDRAQPRLREHDDGREQTQTQDAEGPSTGGLAWRAAGPKCGETLAPGADRRLVGPRGLGPTGSGWAGRGSTTRPRAVSRAAQERGGERLTICSL